MLQLYIYWTLIYLPITFWRLANNDLNVFYDILSFSRGFLLVGENYYSWPLWYLFSMIYSLLFIYLLLLLRKSFKFIFIASIWSFILYVCVIEISTFNSNLDIYNKFKSILNLAIGNGRTFSGML